MESLLQPVDVHWRPLRHAKDGKTPREFKRRVRTGTTSSRTRPLPGLGGCSAAAWLAPQRSELPMRKRLCCTALLQEQPGQVSKGTHKLGKALAAKKNLSKEGPITLRITNEEKAVL